MQLGVSLGIPYTLGKPAAVFSPLDLSPILWLDASDTSTITESGGSVSQWDNKGSLGNFTQGTAALQPTTGVTTLNGKNVIDVDGGDRLISADAASAWVDLHNGTEYIVAFVAQSNEADGGVGYLMTTNNGSASNIGMSILLDDRAGVGNEVAFHSVSNGTATLLVSNISDALGFPLNVWNVSTLYSDPDNGTAADRSYLYLNDGTEIGGNNSAGGAVSASDPTSTVALFATSTGAGALIGSIAELIIVSGANATEANRQALRNYLNEKWAVY